MRDINWDNVQDEIRRPVPGGYAVKIIRVEDNEEKECLRIEWDFAEGEFKGVNQETFNSLGFWPIPLFRSYKPTAQRFFKGFKTCVEASNRNYVFKNDPQSLVGKYMGVVLGEEEYLSSKGEIKKRLYVHSVRTGKAIRERDFDVPELKKLDPAKVSLASASAAASASDYSVLDDDDAELPF